MTPDNEILAFALRWLPFGGAPTEDVYVTFGLTLEQFRARLADALIRERPRIAAVNAVALAKAYRL